MTAGVYLEAYLAPLAPWLSRPDVTDVLINRPGEVWIETADGTMSREPADQLTEVALTRLARQIAAASHQGVNREQPLLSATLPDGARVQVVAPPATRGGLAMAVRKHLISDMSLEELSRDGLFEAAARSDPARDAAADAVREAQIDQAALIGGFLKAAVKRRKTIVISGGTASGKTTLLNALVKEIPRSERLVVIEDARLRSAWTTPTPWAWSPCVATSAKPRSTPTPCSPRRCACAPTASCSASCAAAKPSRGCAPSIPAIRVRSPPSTPTARPARSIRSRCSRSLPASISAGTRSAPMSSAWSTWSSNSTAPRARAA